MPSSGHRPVSRIATGSKTAQEGRRAQPRCSVLMPPAYGDVSVEMGLFWDPSGLLIGGPGRCTAVVSCSGVLAELRRGGNWV